MITFITRGGDIAKLDEFLAISLLMVSSGAENTFHIERRDPTTDELDNPDIFVVATGKAYSPEHHNFDKLKNTDKAAFRLVAEFLDIDWMCSRVYNPEWEVRNYVECYGLQAAERKYGTGSTFLKNSIFDTAVLEDFAKDPNNPDMLRFMYRLGVNILKHVVAFSAAMNLFDESVSIMNINGVITLFNRGESVKHLSDWIAINHPEAEVFIMASDEVEGIEGLRFSKLNTDTRKLNFGKIKDRPEIIYYHPSGNMFVINTKHPHALEYREYLNLCNITEGVIQ